MAALVRALVRHLDDTAVQQGERGLSVVPGWAMVGGGAARRHRPQATGRADTATAYVAAVARASVGQWSNPVGPIKARIGKPFSATSKDRVLGTMRGFLADCQEWGWIPVRFQPARALATPRSVLAVLGPDPRVIDDATWAKLVWAGLNLTDEDLSPPDAPERSRDGHFYPAAMVRALVVVWLFSGLRRDEIARLRLGCIRWQTGGGDGGVPGVDGKRRVCLIDVPVNKTGTAFTKPVDGIMGEAIAAWEAVRPPQPLWLDPKTGERVHPLFSHRGRRVGLTFINAVLIPLLCRKAGVPDKDARGRITSHRARSTIATRLGAMANALTAQLQQPEIDAMPFAERLALLVDIQHSAMLTAALAQRLTRAGMRQSACLENLDLRTPRGLDRSTMQALASGLWIRQHRNVLNQRSGGNRQKLDCLRAWQSGRPRRRLGALQAPLAAARRVGDCPAAWPSSTVVENPGAHPAADPG